MFSTHQLKLESIFRNIIFEESIFLWTEDLRYFSENIDFRDSAVFADVSSPYSESDSTISTDGDVVEANEQKQEKKLLDLYSGCGGMSTGLCLGADVCGVKLVTVCPIILDGCSCPFSCFMVFFIELYNHFI